MKKPISLDFIIIFLFGFYFLISWASSKILFFIIFFVFCFIYLLIDYKLTTFQKEKQKNNYLNFKKVLFFIIIFYLLTVSVVWHSFLRAENRDLIVHDNIQQIEPAVKFLIQGKNPYEEDYFNTELIKTQYIKTTQGEVLFNNSLYHLISLPFHTLVSVPFYYLFNATLGFYDQRLVYLIFFIVSLFALFSLPKTKQNKFSLTAFYALNPLFFNFFVFGRNDVLVLSFIIFIIYFLKNKKIMLASSMLAFACTVKHSAFFIVPFFYSYLYFVLDKNYTFLKKVKSLILQTWIFPVIFLIIILPFVFWNPIAFYDDTFRYPAGTIETSYPINGYGFSVLLYKLGYVKNLTDYLPLWMVQLPITLVALFFLIKFQKKENNLSVVVLNFTFLILIYWFFSRFFHDNYIGFASQMFLIAYFINDD